MAASSPLACSDSFFLIQPRLTHLLGDVLPTWAVLSHIDYQSRKCHTGQFNEGNPSIEVPSAQVCQVDKRD